MGITGFREPPQAGMIEEALAQARPDLERLFQRHWVTADEADELLTEALSSLVVRWGRLGDPSAWFLGAVEKAIRCRILMPLFRSQ